MQFAVVGGGAMGSLFAGRLARAGHAVWVVDTNPDLVREVATNGLRIATPEGELLAAVDATDDPAAVPASDFAFLFVKAYDTARATQLTLAHLTTPAVVTLQNGLGNLEALAAAFGRERVIGGVTAQGATSMGDGYVRHAGEGPTMLAEATGEPTPRVQALAAALTAAGLATTVTEDLDAAIWGKLVVNCAINAVGALTRLPNGMLASDEHAVAALAAAAREAAAVARAQGIALSYEDPARYAQEVCRSTANNVNSMLQDVLRGQPTEVDAINGAVARLGAAIAVPTPVNSALATLVQTIEANYHRQVQQ